MSQILLASKMCVYFIQTFFSSHLTGEDSGSVSKKISDQMDNIIEVR